MAQRRNSLVLIGVAAALTVLAVALAREQRLGFVGSCDWLYYIPKDQHHWPGVVYPLVLFLGFLAGVIALARRPERLGRPALAASLAGLTLLAFLLHLAIDTVTPGGSAESVMAIPRSNVFYHS